ncbi:MAG: flagellar basal body-associated FliL family protein [Armatimonadota bacterium]|nr:flagellar basal body-associated FliL family protein [bacterium]MCS7310166.1 flagellar basal body-associated FliL family protein [Armatimonadota bacterium]MDW8105618.1 flagellar basal body-associated FliL family protein [Armatimonadota bacterium]MDW8290771.1 flagellar basal body-associated FliL family protein [Armatimonadota bacterium]
MAAKKGAAEGASGGGKSKATILFLVVGIVVGAVVAFGASKILLGKSKEEKKEEKTLPEHTLELDEFIVNLADGSHYAKVTLALGLEKPIGGGEHGKVEPKLLAPIRDTVISVFSSKSMSQLVSHEGKEQTKEELKEKLNKLLGDEVVKQVYFTSLTLQ